MKIITVEEHYVSKKANDKIKALMVKNGEVTQGMLDYVDYFINNSLISNLSDERIAVMDKEGVDAQVVGYGNFPPSNVGGDASVELCQMVNDELYEATQKYKGRFYAYAQLPFDKVDESVKELERCVKELKFVGVMFNGTLKGKFLDDERFIPIFKKCVELDVPVYLHPGTVENNISDAYYAGKWGPGVTMNFAGYGIGWHYEVGVHALRMILSGLLDKIPNLKFIIGHWGELLPFYFDRLDMGLNTNVTKLNHDMSYYLKNNFYTNPSGMYFKDDMDFCIKTMGVDHILWGEDFCYLSGVPNHLGKVSEFLQKYDIDEESKNKIAYKNATKLFKIGE